MKYAKWYFLLISRAQARVDDVVGERHHIVPRTLDGSNEKSNLVKLTFREHFLAHWLLVKFTCGEDKRKMNHALSRMNGSNNNGRPKLTSWQYERAKVANSDAHKNQKWSPERRAKLSAAHKGRTSPMKGNRHTDETIAQMSAARKGKKISPEIRAQISIVMKGRKFTDEHKAKISATKKGKKWTEERRQAQAMNGFKHSAETKANMSAARKGKPAWNKGKRKGDLHV